MSELSQIVAIAVVFETGFTDWKFQVEWALRAIN
jgi:hypothetical protein